MIDTHAHLFYLKKQLKDVVAKAKKEGVTHIINVGVNIDSARTVSYTHLTLPTIYSV